MKITWLISIVLLFFIGLSAIYGGVSLMHDPSGGGLQMPFYFILNSPFNSYFIPGLILFVMLGLSGIKIGILTLLKWRYYKKLIILQGLIIIGWIVMQIVLLKVLFWLQFVIGGIGIAILISGFLLLRDKETD